VFSNFDGSTYEGETHLEVIVYDNEEETKRPDGSKRQLFPLSRWVESLRPGDPLRVMPPSEFGGADPASLAPAVLATIPATALIEFRWRFTRRTT
jgi:hypothetical protein